MPEMAGFHLINTSIFLKLVQLAFYLCVWSLLFCNEILVATQPTTSQLISKLSAPQLLRMCLQYELPWIYLIKIKKAMEKAIFQEHFWDLSYFLIGMAVRYKIKFWMLIFWLPQMICSGDVSTSWCWCQVLFMLSCPLGLVNPSCIHSCQRRRKALVTNLVMINILLSTLVYILAWNEMSR